MKDKYEVNAKIFKAFSDQNRLKIIKILSDGEKCACELLNYVKFTQPTLSHHMKVLIDCKLVTLRKEGIWNYYSLIQENNEEVIKFLKGIISQKDILKSEDK